MQHDAGKHEAAAEITDQGAVAIYQSWLDELATAVWDRDYDTIAGAMLYPGKMIAADAELEFDGPEAMIEAARAFRDNLAQMRADAYHRICSAAWFVGENAERIEGSHMTYILSGGRYLVEPFMNAMTLVWKNGRWLGGGLRSDIRNSSFVLLSPHQLTQQFGKPEDPCQN